MSKRLKHQFRCSVVLFRSTISDIRHRDIIAVNFELESRLQANKFTYKVRHADKATVHRTAFHSHQSAALAEHFRIVLIHPFRQHAMFFLAESGQMSVSSAMHL